MWERRVHIYDTPKVFNNFPIYNGNHNKYRKLNTSDHSIRHDKLEFSFTLWMLTFLWPNHINAMNVNLFMAKPY